MNFWRTRPVRIFGKNFTQGSLTAGFTGVRARRIFAFASAVFGPVPHLPHREKRGMHTGKTGFGIEEESALSKSSKNKTTLF